MTDEVLARRYASPEMVELWTDRTRNIIGRGLWLAAMKARGVPETVRAAYREAIDVVDLESIARREAETGHELKAMLDEFNAQAGHQAAHRGLTSSDITENVTIWQVRRSVSLLYHRAIAVASRLGGLIGIYGEIPMVGRTHNLPAQVTTIGLRFAQCAQDMALACNALTHDQQFATYRGFKGAVGTAADLLRTLSGDPAQVVALDAGAATIASMSSVAACGRQVAPRGADVLTSAAVLALCVGPAACATTIRLMVGQGLCTELPPLGSTGSTAMPHKANPRYAERVTGLLTVVRGYAHMLSERAGDIWNEGDITDSSIRRIALPGLFLAADGLLRTFMVTLDRFEPNLQAIDAELERHRFEMQTGRLLDAAIAKGTPREIAHAAIRDWCRTGVQGDRVLDDSEVDEILARPWDIGMAKHQCDTMLNWVQMLVEGHEPSASYDPGAML